MSIQKQISSGNPFELRFSLTAFEYILEHIIPKLETSFPLVYKGDEKFELKHLAAEILVDIHLEKKINLFDFKARFKLGDREFKLEELKLILQGGRKNIILEDGTVMSIENLWELRRWMDFLERFSFKQSEKEFKGPVSAALELDEFLSGTDKKTVKGNQEFLDAIQELREKKPIEEITLPKEVDSKLRDYQKEGVYWLHFLCKYGFGGILADEMGLGKTIQALTLLSLHKDEGVHLILCPKSLIYTWEAEVKKFLPDLKILIIDGESSHRKELLKEASKYNLLISSYSLLQKDYQHYLDEDIRPYITILDEAHYLKNMHTQSSKAVRLLPAKHRFLLTGTPLENNLDELYSAFELIMPGYLGERNEFRREFMLRIEQNSQNALKELQAKIRPFILRRSKSQVLKELPAKQEQRIICEMNNKQTALYKELISRLRGEVRDLVERQGFEQSRIQVLSAILKLRQICNHAGLLDKSFLEEPEISGKYELFLELLNESVESGSKCLVFSQFTSMLDIMENDLKKDGINYLRLDGSTKNRQELVDQFNADESVKVFLISLKAGGVGLNLTAASRVFLYDPWWNPMAEQQAVDRAHRIGQEKRVHIYKLITKNSIEEKILKLQERKGRLFDNLVKEEEGVFKRLEWDDLLGLFDD
jgi:SNF2 family DNA or RNA helicase